MVGFEKSMCFLLYSNIGWKQELPPFYKLIFREFLLKFNGCGGKCINKYCSNLELGTSDEIFWSKGISVWLLLHGFDVYRPVTFRQLDLFLMMFYSSRTLELPMGRQPWSIIWPRWWRRNIRTCCSLLKSCLMWRGHLEVR